MLFFFNPNIVECIIFNILTLFEYYFKLLINKNFFNYLFISYLIIYIISTMVIISHRKHKNENTMNSYMIDVSNV